MKVKKFIAPTMSEAMKKIKEELGPDAIILNSKEVTSGGIFGLFSHKSIEVIAATENAARVSQKKEVFEPKKESRKVPQQLNEPIFPDFTQIMKEEQEQEKEKKIEKSPFQPLSGIDVATSLMVNPEYKKEKVQNELTKDMEKNELNEEIIQLKHLIQELNKSLDKHKQPVVTTLVEERELIEHLQSHSIAEKYIEHFHKKIPSNEQWRKKLSERLFKELKDISFGAIDYNHKYIGLVGPTGVGKTTTLAKLAADAILNHEKRVAFITMDTYRIGAIEQLRMYSTVLGIPLEVCYNQGDFIAAKEKLKEYDTIFIDTSGRNYREKKYVDELTKLIQLNEMSLYLVFSLSAKDEDVRAMYKHFTSIPIQRFIFTKYDETGSYGTMLNMVLDTGIGVGYITNGQGVPDDIVTCTKEVFIEMFVKEGIEQ